MSSEPDIEIVDYHDDIAQELADMFNSWDELWPGGFTGGVPYTAERIRRNYGSLRAVRVLVAMERGGKRAVGFCSLLQHWEDKEAAYIGLLGVVPDVLGKRVGKRLLLEAMRTTIGHGYERVDLHTWAGNERALPLYKKMGLMWSPEGEGVRLESYIPAVLAHPLCRRFFDRHGADRWYELQVRELDKAPDDIDDSGMSVYVYRFRAGSDYLTVTVDRLCRAITGVESSVDGERLRVHARVAQHKTLCGIPNTFELVVENGTHTDLPVRASLTPFEHLHVEGATTTETTVRSGDTLSWRLPVTADTSAEPHRRSHRTPALLTSVTLDDVSFELRTGMRIHPVAEVTLPTGPVRILPGGKVELPLSVTNRSSSVLRGRLVLSTTHSALSVTPTEHEIEVAPEGLSGLVAHLSARPALEGGPYYVRAHLVVELSSPEPPVTVTTRDFMLPVACTVGGRAVCLEERMKHALIVMSEVYDVQIQKEGAYVSISGRHFPERLPFGVSSEIGPPFGLSPFESTERDASVETTPDRLVVSLSADHPEKPLRVEDRVIFPTSSHVVTHEVWVTNLSSEPHSFELRLSSHIWGISMTKGICTAYVPLNGGVVRGSAVDTLFQYPALPDDPSAYAEQWAALYDGSRAAGQVWQPDGVAKVRIWGGQVGHLEYGRLTVGPHETVCVSRFWFVVEVPHWADVRREWLRLVARREESLHEARHVPATRHFIDLEARPEVMVSPGPVELHLRLRAAVSAPMPVPVTVSPPPGWRTSDGQGDAVHQISLQDVAEVAISLTPTECVGPGLAVHTGRATLLLPSELEFTYHVVQLGGRGEVEVVEDEDEGLKVFRVRNGLIEYAVSADFGGCLYSLTTSQDTRLLSSAFPRPAPLEFFQNYYGGVQPLVWSEAVGEGPERARTNQEEMSARPFASGHWQGVEVTWTSEVQDAWQGAQFAVRYLTAPQSPLVMVEMASRNPTGAPLVFSPSLMVHPSVNGSLEGTVLDTRISQRRTTIRPAPFAVFTLTQSGSCVLRPVQSGASAVGVAGAPRDGVLAVIHLGNVVLAPFMGRPDPLTPGEGRRIRLALVTDPAGLESLEELARLLHDM